MADGVTLPGTGEKVASDDAGASGQVQLVKLALSADGSATPVDADSSGLKVQLGAALPAGSAAIGKLAANSGVDIGDVDVLTVPAPLSTTGTGTEATALRVTLATDSTGLISVDDNGASLTVDGTVALGAGAAVIGHVIADSGSTTAVTGAVTVIQGTGTNLHTVVDSGTITAVTAITNALPAGANNIGDVDVLTIAAGDNNIGNVDIVTMPNVTLAAGTNTNEVVGDVAHDIAIAGNPITVGGRASAAAPTSVDADDDAVRAWFLRNGAQATVLTAAGALIGGDAANGIDVDVTRLPSLVAGSAYVGKVRLTDGTTDVVIDVAYADGESNSEAHPNVQANGMLYNGSTWDRVRGDTTNGLDVDVTRLPALVAGSALIGAVNPQGYQVTVSTGVTRPADTSIYAADDVWSDSTSAPTAGGYTFSGCARANNGSGIILDAVVTSSAVPATKLQGEIWIFDTAITAVNDNAAFVLSDPEVLTYVGKIPFTLESAGANNSAYYANNLGIAFTCIGGAATLRYLIRVKNAYTPVSGEVLTVRLKILQVT